MQDELEGLKKSLKADKQNLEVVASDCDRLRSLCNEKDEALQVKVLISWNESCLVFTLLTYLTNHAIFQAAIQEKRNMEARMAKLSNVVIENSAKEGLIGENNQVRYSIKLLFTYTASFFLFMLLILLLMYKLWTSNGTNRRYKSLNMS